MSRLAERARKLQEDRRVQAEGGVLSSADSPRMLVSELDLTGDGHRDSVGYDTTGDGVIDAFDTNGDGNIDARIVRIRSMRDKARASSRGEVAAASHTRDAAPSHLFHSS